MITEEGLYVHTEEHEEELSFARVNFNDINSILNYGHEVQDELVRIADELTSSIEEYKDNNIDLSVLEKIVSFSESMGDTTTGKKHLPVLFRKTNDVDTPKELQEQKSRYTEYKKNLMEVRDTLKRMIIQSEMNTQKRKILADKIKKYIPKLEQIIEIGLEDRNSFVFKIEELEMQLTHVQDCEQEMLANEISQMKHYLSLFDERLKALRYERELAMQRFNNINIQQNNELAILVNMSNAINQLIPSMMINGSIHVGNLDQKYSSNFLIRLSEIYNESAQADSKLLLENVQTISELSGRVGINPETLLLMQQVSEQCKAYLDVRSSLLMSSPDPLALTCTGIEPVEEEKTKVFSLRRLFSRKKR